MDFSNLTLIITNKRTSPEEKEEAIMNILLNKPLEEIPSFLVSLPELWVELSLARTTKIIKKVLNTFEPNFETLKLVENLISCYETKKLLKLDLLSKRISILLSLKKYQECLESINELIRELKKYDDKINQINLHVYESIAQYELKNLTRAKAALSSARALSVSTFCPVIMQAQIDRLSGMYICDDRNYGTAYSYFMESLDGYIMEKKGNEAINVARYILLSKIVGEKYNEVEPLLKKLDVKTSRCGFNLLDDPLVKMMKEINLSCLDRNLSKYNHILSSHKDMLNNDSFLVTHLCFLYDRLLENNIIKIIEPYSKIYIHYIAKKIKLVEEVLEQCLRKMILNGKILGILDHANKTLIIMEKKEKTEFKYLKMLDDLIEFTSKN